MTQKLMWVPFACFLAGTPVFANPSLSIPPASFIDYHVSTVNELTQEVTIDSVVCKRLARHFHITEPQMVAYTRQNLVLRRLGTAGVYQVACVRPNGSEYWVQAHLSAGTQVFASRATGQPVLKLACGNPMVTVLPKRSSLAAFNEVTSPPKLAPVPTEERMAAAPALALLPEEAALPDTIVASNLDVPPVVKVAGSLESFVSAVKPISSSGSFNFLPALAGVGAAIGLLHQGSSQTTVTASPVTPTPTVTPPPQVPEASTFVSLGLLMLGGGLLVWRQHGLKRSQKSA